MLQQLIDYSPSQHFGGGGLDCKGVCEYKKASVVEAFLLVMGLCTHALRCFSECLTDFDSLNNP